MSELTPAEKPALDRLYSLRQLNNYRSWRFWVSSSQGCWGDCTLSVIRCICLSPKLKYSYRYGIPVKTVTLFKLLATSTSLLLLCSVDNSSDETTFVSATILSNLICRRPRLSKVSFRVWLCLERSLKIIRVIHYYLHHVQDYCRKERKQFSAMLRTSKVRRLRTKIKKGNLSARASDACEYIRTFLYLSSWEEEKVILDDM